MVMIRSPWPLLCFSTSIWAPVALRIALILLPPRPMTRLMADAGTATFLTRYVGLVDLKVEERFQHAEVMINSPPNSLKLLWRYSLAYNFFPFVIRSFTTLLTTTRRSFGGDIANGCRAFGIREGNSARNIGRSNYSTVFIEYSVDIKNKWTSKFFFRKENIICEKCVAKRE